MLFNSFQFLWLFPSIFLVYWGLASMPKLNDRTRHRIVNLALIIVSYGLYMQWKPAFALLLLGVTAVTYGGGLILDRGAEYQTQMADIHLFCSRATSSARLQVLQFHQ